MCVTTRPSQIRFTSATPMAGSANCLRRPDSPKAVMSRRPRFSAIKWSGTSPRRSCPICRGCSDTSLAEHAGRAPSTCSDSQPQVESRTSRNVSPARRPSSPRDRPVPLHYSGTCTGAAERGAGERFLLSTLHRRRIRGVLVYVDHPRDGIARSTQHPAEEALGSRSVPFGGEQELDRLATRIHGAIQILVLALHLYIRVVRPIAFVGRLQMWAAALRQFGAYTCTQPRCNWGPLPRRVSAKSSATCS